MFREGEKIIYGSNGVCMVEKVGVPPFAKKGENRLYYKLRLAGGTETIYAPVDGPVFMRPVISRQEAEDLIARMPEIQEQICTSHSIALLRQQYDAFFQSHNCETYVRLVKGVYLKGQQGKKLGQTDQRYMKRAEDVLYGELAAALDIPMEEVPDYIRTTLATTEDAG